MVCIVLVQPGATDFDDQGRIKGSLSMPLSENGRLQVQRVVGELAEHRVDIVYCSPCESAQDTAVALARSFGIKYKTVDKLRNLDHGLWHGKLIDEVRRQQPRVYRCCQEHPEAVCPPQGEAILAAQERVRSVIGKILRKHKRGVVAVVVPEPLASIARSILQRRDLPDLWKSECDTGNWELIDVAPDAAGLPAS